jgi:hypothetical protein
MLGLKYSILYADNLTSANLPSYLSNSTCALLTSDPETLLPGLLDWVSSGKILIVLNTNGNGFFMNRVGFRSSSDLIYEKEYELGKIVYINIYQVLESGIFNILYQQNFIASIKNEMVTDRINSELRASLPGVNFNMTYGTIKVKGNIVLSTDLTVIEGAPNEDSNFNKTFITTIYGKSNLCLQNSTLYILPQEPYLLIKPENGTCQAQLSIDHKAKLIINNSLETPNITDEKPTELKINAKTILVKAPLINASGEIFFERLYVHVAPYIPLAGIVLDEAKIQGTVTFNTLFVTKQVIFFSNFKAIGNIVKPPEYKPPLVIPWIDIIKSMPNLALCSVLILAIIIKTKRSDKTKN